MSTSYKLLVVGAAMMFVAMIAISSFSLGLYLGVHGDWPLGPLSPAGPGAPGNQLPGGPGNLLPRGPAPQSAPGGLQQPGAPAPQTAPGGFQQPGAPGGVPSRLPDLVGQVRSISGDTLTIETPQGKRMVLMNEDTEVRHAEGAAQASREEIQRGSHLAVFGEFDAAGRTLTAYLLLILPEKPVAP